MPETYLAVCPRCGWISAVTSSVPLAACINCGANTPRTQKGRGLVILHILYHTTTVGIHYILQKESDVDALAGAKFPYFARPAPSEPKHGYIDSRVVNNAEECRSLLKQVLADDPGGELLLCPFIKARLNMIWTPTSMTIGKGNDGATAGRNAVVIPLAGAIRDKLKASLGSAGVKGGLQPYVEAVQGVDRFLVLTQLRAGPAVPMGNYVPRLTVVEKVVRVDQRKYKDRSWELFMDSLAGTPGVVVWHPGGAMTDHFSIHAFANKIPVLLEKEQPKVGDVLEPTKSGVQEFDPEAMLKGVVAGDKLRLKYKDGDSGGAVMALLIGLHNSTAMTGEHSKWIGMAASIMLRLGCAALRGEARHLMSDGNKPCRGAVYKRVLNYSITRHRASVTNLVNIFRYGSWSGGGFGGMKWAYCGAATTLLFQAVKELARNPCEETAAGLVKALNIAVNQAHNGGWWLNKFADADAFEGVQDGDPYYVLRGAGTLYTLSKIYASLSEAVVDKETAGIASWPDTDLHPPAVTAAKLVYQPSVRAISVEFSTRLLGKRGKSISAKLKENVPKEVMDALADNTYLLRTPDGYSIEVRGPSGSVSLWRDSSIVREAKRAAKGGGE